MNSQYLCKIGLSLLLGLFLVLSSVMSLAANEFQDDIEIGNGGEDGRQTGDGSDDEQPGDEKDKKNQEVTLTSWRNGKDDVSINFDNNGEPDIEAQIDLPKTVTITNVSFNITGMQGISTNHTQSHDFTAGNDASAWKGANDSAAFFKPLTLMDIEIPPSQYQNLETADGQIESMTSSSQSVYHLFRFNVTNTIDVSHMEATWTGYARQTPHPFEYVSQLYVFNNLILSWELLGQESSPLNEGQTYTIKENLSHTFSSMKYFVNGTSVYLLAMAPIGAKESATLYTDYIALDVDWGEEVYPQRPTLDIGSDGNTNWTYSGEFPHDLEDTVILDDNEVIDFTESVQQVIWRAGFKQGNLTLSFHFNASSAGKLICSDLRVTYLLNTAPQMISPIPSTYSVFEDSGETSKLINLHNYFWDDKGPDNLRFEFITEDYELIEIIQGRDQWFGIKPIENQYGEATFRVLAFDNGSDFQMMTSDDLSIESNEFTVTVLPTNDPPVIGALNFPSYIVYPDRVVKDRYWVNGSGLGEGSEGTLGLARVGSWVNGTITAMDVDGDSLTISHDITAPNFDISSEDVDSGKKKTGDLIGIISFNPLPSDQTKYKNGEIAWSQIEPIFRVTITVSDNNITSGVPLSTSIELFIPVKHQNREPTIWLDESKVTIEEDSWYNTTVHFTDPDLEFGEDYPKEWREALDVWSDLEDVFGDIQTTPLLDEGAEDIDHIETFEVSEWSFDTETGELAIRPSNAAVGNRNITFFVFDKDRVQASTQLWLVVSNINDAPMAKISNPTEGQIFDARKILTFEAFGTYDPDTIHGDELTYNWTSSIDGKLGENETVETNLSAGAHTITLVVEDKEGLNDTDSITITVKPKDDSDPSNGDDDDDGVDDDDDDE